MNSAELFERAKKIAPGGVHSPVRSFKGMGQAPIFFKSAFGAYLTSVEDKKYIDFCMSFGPLILGHRDPDVSEAVHKMVDTAWSFGACEPYSLELAEWISENLPWMEKLRFVSSGTEAVMSALRVARAATGRSLVLKFEGCYHGHADSLLVQAGSGLAGLSAASSSGVPPEVAAQTLVSKLDDEKGLDEVFQNFGDKIAAVIIEPLPANFGLLPQRIEFLKKISSLCKKHGALYIFDEVISGFRVGLGGMVTESQITPDLVCYGKVIGGGFPVGCYGGRSDLMDFVAPMGPVYQAGTLSANPVGMRAGLVSLKKMQSQKLWDTLKIRGDRLAKDLIAGFKAKGLGLTVSHVGSLFWIHEEVGGPIRSIAGIPKSQGEKFKSLFLKCLDSGIYLAPNAFEVGFLSVAHTDAILQEATEKILKASEIA
jgi:glutamate-1-semialdehyde 2,1-aminomutase